MGIPIPTVDISFRYVYRKDMKRKRKKMLQVRVQFTDAQLEWLDKESDRLGDSRSSVIRTAVVDLMERKADGNDVTPR